MVLDAMPIDPDIDSPSDYTPPPRDGSNNNEFFNNQKPLNAGKLTTGVSNSKKRTNF